MCVHICAFILDSVYPITKTTRLGAFFSMFCFKQDMFLPALLTVNTIYW